MSDRFARRATSTDIVSGLATPDVYPGRPPSVEVHETHGSWVFVAGERALKIKRPVELAILDYSALERRRAMCHEEVRLNRRLAPRLYLAHRRDRAQPRPRARADRDDDEAPGVVEVGVLYAPLRGVRHPRRALGGGLGDQRAAASRRRTHRGLSRCLATAGPGRNGACHLRRRCRPRSTISRRRDSRLPAGALHADAAQPAQGRAELPTRGPAGARARAAWSSTDTATCDLQHVLLTDPVAGPRRPRVRPEDEHHRRRLRHRLPRHGPRRRRRRRARPRPC